MKFGWFSIAANYNSIPESINLQQFVSIANANSKVKKDLLSVCAQILLERFPVPSVDKLESLRTSTNYKQTKQVLKPELTVIYTAGVFGGSKELKSLKSLSGLCAIDIDLNELNEVKRAQIMKDLFSLDCVVLVSHSIGFGVWCLVKYELNQKLDVSEIDIQKLFKAIYGAFIQRCSEISIDVSLIDTNADRATQARFIADCVVCKQTCKPILIDAPKIIPQYNYLPPAPRDTSNLFMDILEKISHLDLIHTNHTWNNFAAFLKGCLGENGRYYFHKISSNNIKYSPEASEKKFNQVKPFYAKNPLNVLISYIPQNLFNLKDYLNEKNRVK